MKGRMILIFLIVTMIASVAWGEGSILIRNASVFDGKNQKLTIGADVLVEGNLIKSIGKNLDPGEAAVVNAGGKTLMPGLIDAHWHTTYAYTPQITLVKGDALEVAIRSAQGAEKTLLRGFTTTRDAGGNPFALKKMIDSGELIGPRILPSGPPISQTSGHFDFRDKNATPANPADPLDYWRRNMVLAIADGVPEMIKTTRENLRAGATQIKIATGGGVSSTYDPLDVSEFTFDEIKAAVEVADNWNTYVLTHVMTDKAIKASIKAGVKSIEHGFFASDETLELMKKQGVWLVPQPFEKSDLTFDNTDSQKKFNRVCDAVESLYERAKRKGVKVGFGSDLLFSPEAAANQGALLVRLKRWFSPYEVLKMATSENAELLELAGPRHPYQKGKLGEIEEGAYADLILVDGNPLENIDLVADPDKNFVMIMKDGVIYKNTLN